MDLKEIIDILGKENVFIDEDTIKKYSHDENSKLNFPPEVVVKPKNKYEISSILKFANMKKIPVTPRGGGTGLCGGAVPIHGGILLSLERLNKILEIDKENLVAVVEPGVITQDLKKEVEKQKLFYPPDPASADSCSIGGNLATCAGGVRAVKYGTTKDYVLGIEFVTPTGEILNYGGKILKNSAGYQIINLIIGSEGTLGIITKIFLKLLLLPEYKILLFVPYSDINDACKTVYKIFESGIVPSVVELIDQRAIELTEKLLKRNISYSNAKVYLLIEIDGKQENVEKYSQIVGSICMNERAIDVIVCEDYSQQERLWEVRKNISEAIKNYAKNQEIIDACIPRSEIYKLVNVFNEVSKEYDVEIIYFGHAGDGNIHTHIIFDNTSNEKIELILTKLFNKVIELGGTITGEHGIGIAKKKYLSLMMNDKQIQIMKEIKKVFDPNNILNPGKIFDL
jgi:glycolate oxidase